MIKKNIAIVFAAGRGTRLAPLTDTLPKPLATVQGKTLLELNMQRIAHLVDGFVIVVSYLEEQIRDYIGNRFLDKSVEYIHQNNNKGGTLDAFRTGIYQGNQQNLDCNYIVINADEIHGKEIYTQFFQSITLNPELALVSARKFEDRSKLSSFGIYQVDDENNFITIWEKPQTYISDLVNTGIYYFPSKVKEFINNQPNTTDQEEYITRDLFIPYHQKYPIKVLTSTDLWFPISNLSDLAKAQNIDIDFSL